jgi:hypothetical protein
MKTSSILKCDFAYCDLLELQWDPYEYNGSYIYSMLHLLFITDLDDV